jgi:hypothetical protein
VEVQPQKFNPFVTKSDGEENIGKIVGWKYDRIPKDISMLNDRPHPPTLKPIKSPPIANCHQILTFRAAPIPQLSQMSRVPDILIPKLTKMRISTHN